MQPIIKDQSPHCGQKKIYVMRTTKRSKLTLLELGKNLDLFYLFLALSQIPLNFITAIHTLTHIFGPYEQNNENNYIQCKKENHYIRYLRAWKVPNRFYKCLTSDHIIKGPINFIKISHKLTALFCIMYVYRYNI